MPKKLPDFHNFGEYLYYANLQMLHYALKDGKPRYDRICYMIRAKAFKAYKEGRWQIHDLFEFNITKIKENNYCWYCGKEMEPSKLTKDHVFPRAKGGDNNLDNIIRMSRGQVSDILWYKMYDVRRKMEEERGVMEDGWCPVCEHYKGLTIFI